MKKNIILFIFLLPLLTGYWDRLQLKTLHLVDVLGFDWDEKTGEYEADFLFTKLKSAGQGSGEPESFMKKLKGSNLAEAIGAWEYVDQAPFIGISTRVYMISQRFASHDPVSELAFLLQSPYASNRSPLVAYEGSLSRFMETSSKSNKEFTKDLNEFILSLGENKIIPTVSVMKFIQARNEPLSDLVLPVLKEMDSNVELGGALLFRNGKPTGTKLEKEQVKIMMLMLPGNSGRQRYLGNFSTKKEKQSISQKKKTESEKSNQINFGFTIKDKDIGIALSEKSSKLPKVKINVKLQINLFKLGEGKHKLDTNYVNQIEKDLEKHFENMASDTIKTMQTANSDVLNVGKEIRAYHPKLWKSLDWRKDYPKMTIEPKFAIQILNGS